MSAASQPPARGRMIDIGGRSLHMVCLGPAGGGPVVVMEAGAFGLSADWGAVQARLAAAEALQQRRASDPQRLGDHVERDRRTVGADGHLGRLKDLLVGDLSGSWHTVI